MYETHLSRVHSSMCLRIPMTSFLSMSISLMQDSIRGLLRSDFSAARKTSSFSVSILGLNFYYEDRECDNLRKLFHLQFYREPFN